jgi:hypothetical protein
MTIRVPIETAERDLRALLDELGLGETATLIGSEGKPEGLLISLKPMERQAQAEDDWEARWDALARKVSSAWQSEKSAVEILAEMRR